MEQIIAWSIAWYVLGVYISLMVLGAAQEFRYQRSDYWFVAIVGVFGPFNLVAVVMFLLKR